MKLSPQERSYLKKLEKSVSSHHIDRYYYLLGGVFILGITLFAFYDLFQTAFKYINVDDSFSRLYLLKVIFFYPECWLTLLLSVYLLGKSIANWSGNPEHSLLVKIIKELSDENE